MHIAGMPAITIRNVPQDVRTRLATRAAASGQSLQEYLLAELTSMSGRPAMTDVLAGLRARVSGSGTNIGAEEIVEIIRRDRDDR